jgi:hypothetical protein
LIRAANKAANNKYRIAMAPIMLPAAFGLLWYLLAILNLNAPDAGREFFAGPLYLLGWALAIGVLASIYYKVSPSS